MTPAHLEHPTAFSCCGTLVRLWCQKATQQPVCDQDFIFFPLKVMQIVVGESNRNWGFVVGGWASTQLSPRGCQWCLPMAWDISWPPARWKGALSPASLTQRPVPPASLSSSIAMAPQCHSLSTVSKLRNTAGDTQGVGGEVWDHSLPANTGPKHIFTRLYTGLTVPPIRVSALGLPGQ